MQFLVVILAAFVAYAFGAVWYTFMSKPWMVAAGIPMDASGKPKGNGDGAMALKKICLCSLACR